MKILLFDLGGVCLSNHWSKEQREKFSKEFNLNFEEMENYHIKNVKEINTGKLDEKSYFKNLFTEQKKEPKIEEAINFTRKNNYEFKDVLQFIKELKSKYKIFALTNEIKEAADFRIEKFKLKEYFDEIFVSSYIGMEKFNESKIYKYVIKKLNAEAENIIFVDDKESNLIHAKELGIKTIHFKNLTQLKEDIKNIGIE
ncbi:HAD-IA family hydrolase [Candidatus Woesearchaeota archaeon]|nr:HAD-IA family hydrolase [Candidatus Woesearchaeota archaeon]